MKKQTVKKTKLSMDLALFQISKEQLFKIKGGIVGEDYEAV